MSANYVYGHPEGEHPQIYRDGIAIADIIEGKVVMRPEHIGYKIQARSFWKAHNATPEAERLHVPSPLDTVTEAGFVKHGEKVSVDASIPPCPPMDPLLGTKTEAVVAWFKRYQPEEWAKIHKGWIGK